MQSHRTSAILGAHFRELVEPRGQSRIHSQSTLISWRWLILGLVTVTGRLWLLRNVATCYSLVRSVGGRTIVRTSGPRGIPALTDLTLIRAHLEMPQKRCKELPSLSIGHRQHIHSPLPCIDTASIVTCIVTLNTVNLGPL